MRNCPRSGNNSSPVLGKHMALIKRPLVFRNVPLWEEEFLLRLILSSSGKVQRSELVRAPLLPVKWFPSPVVIPSNAQVNTTPPGCCTLLWWVIYTDVFNCAGGPYFYVLFLRFRLRFYTRPPRFLLFYFVVIKKILSTNFFFSSRFSSGCRRSLSVNSNQFPT